MNAFFAMGVPTTTDDSGYWLRLPHLLSVFVIPVVCFYALLAFWVVRTVRGALAAGPGAADAGSASGPPADSPPQPPASDAAIVAESKAEDPTPTRLELRPDVTGLAIQSV